MTSAGSYKLDEVYGVTRDLPLNYVERKSVDGTFVASLASDRHIVVFGSSKQGKTSLRKHCLKDEDYVVVTCSNTWTSVAAIHAAILKAAGYTVEQSTTKTADGTYKITAKAGGKAGIPLVAQGKAEGEGAVEKATGEAVTTAPLELDPADVNEPSPPSSRSSSGSSSCSRTSTTCPTRPSATSQWCSRPSTRARRSPSSWSACGSTRTA